MNFAITGVLAVFVIVPEVFGADLEGTGARKKMLPVEEHYAYNLKVMWDFEGILRYSPIFYGYYSEKEKGAYLNYIRDLGEKEPIFGNSIVFFIKLLILKLYDFSCNFVKAHYFIIDLDLLSILYGYLRKKKQ